MSSTGNAFPGVVMGALVLFMVVVGFAALMGPTKKEIDTTSGHVLTEDGEVTDPILNHFKDFNSYEQPLIEQAMKKISEGQRLIKQLNKDLHADNNSNTSDAGSVEAKIECEEAREKAFESLEEILFLNHCVLQKLLHDSTQIIQNRSSGLKQRQDDSQAKLDKELQDKEDFKRQGKWKQMTSKLSFTK
ncbi:hypothetical protein NADFUDRAFT_82483 [Nadsonia fulvescens var. elongata DSM 6958]|uniref:Uncharacterized protein n=1 Tax=Nadsonia fulvescens var. elongata DSM 6958 TaxID=857566 RepID=A0A1E3PMU0_9ASCO|nr:hypothetical protein NADFUDRAFT_82483 [Nadsonia fulvescens var. elongata DSM 6958]